MLFSEDDYPLLLHRLEHAIRQRRAVGGALPLRVRHGDQAAGPAGVAAGRGRAGLPGENNVR